MCTTFSGRAPAPSTGMRHPRALPSARPGGPIGSNASGKPQVRSTRALHERPRPPAHRSERHRPRVAPSAGLGVATALRPVLRRPRAVGPHPRRHAVRLRRPDAPQHRAHLLPGRHGRPPGAAWPPPAAGRGPGRGPDRARGRPGVARGGARTGRVHPRTPRGPGARRHRTQHQPAHRAHPLPAGAHLSPVRLRPGPDDRRRVVPLPRPAGRHGRLPARGRRPDPARRRRSRPVRQPQRPLRLPPPRPRLRPGRPPPRHHHRRTGPVPGPVDRPWSRWPAVTRPASSRSSARPG